MILFAYASNMNVDEIATSITSAKKIAIGYLPGYSFIFNRKAADLSAKANIIACEELDAKVWGVLIEVSEEDKQRFFVGHDDIGLIPVTCYDANGKAYEAEVFITPPHAITNYELPYDWHKEKILTYARHQNLPEEYLHQIELMEAKPDPDQKRRQRRLAELKN